MLNADGNVITDSEHIGNRNPFRYRGYYYDTATGLYYLQSRYYYPETGRFINADTVEYLDPEHVNGLNLYAYCLNNPVMYCDPSGHKWYETLWNWINTIFGFLNPVSSFTADASIAVAILSGKWSSLQADWKNGCLNPFNQSAEIALKAQVVNFYKGSTVVNQKTMAPFSILGTIWLNPNMSEQALTHEYGHSI